MADAPISTHQPSYMEFLFPDLDPLPLSGERYSTPPSLKRGPMYSAYAELREMSLRRRQEFSTPEPPPRPTPRKKADSPLVCRSVPDFSAAMRKENRKPAALPTPVKSSRLADGKAAAAKTPPLPPRSAVRKVGSVSADGREEKRRGADAVRKSYACLKELKGFTDVDNGEGGRGNGGPVGRGGGSALRKSFAGVRGQLRYHSGI